MNRQERRRNKIQSPVDKSTMRGLAICWTCGHPEHHHEYNHSPGKGFCGTCYWHSPNRKTNRFAYHPVDTDNLKFLEMKWKQSINEQSKN